MTPLAASDALREGATLAAADGEIILVRRDGRIYGYRNRCPHTGAPLDWQPGQFLDPSGETLLCALHGARFRIEDGACLAGPCAGTGLTPVPIAERDGIVYLMTGEEGPP